MMRSPLRRLSTILVALVALAIVPMSCSADAQEVNAAQRRELRRIEGLVDDAVRALEADRMDRASERLTAAVAALEPITTAPTEGLVTAAKPIYDKLKTVHARLTLEEMEVPISIPSTSLLRRRWNSRGRHRFLRNPNAPMLVGKCGRCHVSAARGGFQMATFEE
ncbi:MAG: hypothetical protein R3B96_13660 [Pirellulaceae bacterium]